MTNSIKNIRDNLKKTMLYDLSPESNITAELMAYDEGFAVLEAKLSQIENSIFVQLAEGESLQKHERLVGLYPRFSSSLKSRREIVMHRLSITPDKFTPEKMLKSISAAGIKGKISEFKSQEIITIVIDNIIDPSLNMEQIKQSLESLMPAHLEWSFDYGVLTFNILDAKNITWSIWDNGNFTWNIFDQKGETLFN